jgi:hypothetical protein
MVRSSYEFIVEEAEKNVDDFADNKGLARSC